MQYKQWMLPALAVGVALSTWLFSGGSTWAQSVTQAVEQSVKSAMPIQQAGEAHPAATIAPTPVTAQPLSNHPASEKLNSNHYAILNPSNSNNGVILDMAQAFKRNDSARLSTLLPAAQGHALEPWAAYWELKARLENAPLADIHDFLERYRNTYQQDRLRNDWLLVVGKRRDWGQFQQHYPLFRMNDDKEVRCYALGLQALQLLQQNVKSQQSQEEQPGLPRNTSTSTSETHTNRSMNAAQMAAIVQEVKKNWYELKESDDGCLWAMAQLGAYEQINILDVLRKVRLSLENDRLSSAKSALSTSISLQGLTLPLQEIYTSPSRFLSRTFDSSTSEYALWALIKLSAIDVDLSVTYARSLQSIFSKEQNNWLWAVIGKRAALKMSSLAHGYFNNVTQDTDLQDEHLSWKVRAALRAQGSLGNNKWEKIQSAIAAMSVGAQNDSTWVYWRAQALLMRGDEASKKQGQQMLSKISSIKGFYEQMAMEDLQKAIYLPQIPKSPTEEEKNIARNNAGLRRAIFAIHIGLRNEGVKEWNYSTNFINHQGQTIAMTDRELMASAAFACEYQIWDRCINTSERTKVEINMQQRYPMPFYEEVVRASQQISLDPSFVYGLVRQESRFIMDARSGVGATGLMQVMPATARWTARKIGLTGFTPSLLGDKQTNIAIGTAYLKLVLDDFEGSMPMAAAAYNAGPGRARAWREGPTLEAAIWAETIPFTETRDYVKKVLANTTAYAALMSAQPQSLKKRLGQVGPRYQNGAPVNTELP